MRPLPQQSPVWLLLFGVAALGAGVEGLISGAVGTPATHGFSGTLERAAQPAAYWMLTAAYLAAGGIFLTLAYRGYRDPDTSAALEPERPQSPGWARALAWLGVSLGGLLLAAGIAAHFSLDPIVRVPFVLLFGGGGFVIGLASIGYLVTGRVT